VVAGLGPGRGELDPPPGHGRAVIVPGAPARGPCRAGPLGQPGRWDASQAAAVIRSVLDEHLAGR